MKATFTCIFEKKNNFRASIESQTVMVYVLRITTERSRKRVTKLWEASISTARVFSFSNLKKRFLFLLEILRD